MISFRPWPLIALLHAVNSSPHAFNVKDDVFAFPQYNVRFLDHHVSELQAQSRMVGNAALDLDLSDESSSDTGLAIPAHLYNGKPNSAQTFEYEILRLDDKRFLCAIPLVEDEPLPTNQTRSAEDEEHEVAMANERGWALLNGLHGQCVYYWAGWWSYRYCYGSGVKQFHQLPPRPGTPSYPPMEDTSVTGFTLGTVQGALERLPTDDQNQVATAENRELSVSKAIGHVEIRGENKYLVQQLRGGDKCDLTGKDRRIEVQFHCNAAGGDRIAMIKEVATCAYLMVIMTPRLCKDAAFSPPETDAANHISCLPILSPEQIPDHQASIAAKASASIAANLPEAFQRESPSDASAQAQIKVGEIVVGAHRLIPADKHIKKSSIVGGGIETFVETVADSMGHLLSPDQIRQLGLGDPKTVEKHKKQLDSIAGDKKWKLEVFDTPQGREYRGVIDDDDDKKSEDGQGEQEGSEETYKNKDEL